MANPLFDLFINYKFAKVIWDSLEKNIVQMMREKKYVVGKWIKFQMVDDKPIMEQVHEYENLTADVLNEGMEMCEILQANVLLEKFSPSWSDYMNQLKHKKKNLTLQELISHMRTEEANRLKDEEAERLKDKMKSLSLLILLKLSLWNLLCNQRQGQRSKQGGKSPVQDNLTESGDVIAAVVVEVNMVSNKTDWILDTGASRHLCANKELFHDFEESTDGECVYMDNYGNLISGALLNKAGLTLIFESDKIIISRGRDFVGKGYLNGGLFVLNIVQEITSNASLSDKMWGEAVLSACYILNRVPHKKLDKTPYEL
ncbi:uncharacterized protein [Nicotiana tomentosiformis]|uniref:uncharacterized protein n=1 Tax=Nicotiana tomentosiformis TaxID=4098 RepID=UPI00388CD2D0